MPEWVSATSLFAPTSAITQQATHCDSCGPSCRHDLSGDVRKAERKKQVQVQTQINIRASTALSTTFENFVAFVNFR